jgi:hypothetical protein
VTAVAGTRGSLREGTEALLNRAQFRDLRLSNLRWLTVCSLLLWTHAYVHRLPGWVVWIDILITGMLFVLAAVYGLMERACRRRASHHAGAIQVRRPWPEFDQLRSGLLWTTVGLTIVPWLTGLGCPLPRSLLAGTGPLAAVVLGPAVAVELLWWARGLALAG